MMNGSRLRPLALVVVASAAVAAAFWLSSTLGPAGAAAVPAAEHPPSGARPAVLLELFTSEGCSSCPPADRLLEELAAGGLARGVEVVPLSLHVDYWNHLGWRDPFSDAAYSRRQERYAGVLPAGRTYTPQLVIDGAEHLVGSDRRAILRSLERARERPKAALTLRPETSGASGATSDVASTADGSAAPEAGGTEPPDRWRIDVDAGAVPHRPARPSLFVAVTEDGLASSVARGENAGHRLNHVAVVRHLDAAGELRLDADGAATRSVTIELDPSWRRDRLHLVVWISDGERGPVLGAAQVAL